MKSVGPPRERDHLDAGTVRELVHRYERPLTLYAARLSGDPEAARDAVQETFLRLCKERPPAGEAHVRAWLYTVCRNLVFDQHRKERRVTPVDPSSALVTQRAEPSESPSDLLELVSSLPEKQQEVIRLKFQSGLSYREIAEVTKLSTGYVGYLIHVAIKALRNKLAQREGLEVVR